MGYLSSQHECVDCAALPVDDRPARSRPTVAGGPRSRRCRSHHKARKAAQKARRHAAHVGRTYGLPPGEYEALLAFQGGTCAIPSCRASGKARKLAVDHDHDTGEPRGLLCQQHNFLLLGRFVNDLQAGLDYIANPPYRQMKAEQEAA